MRSRCFTTIVLATALAAMALTPALAAKKQMHKAKVAATGACAQSAGRCVSDCDQLDWCTVYTCVNGQSTPVPFWRCFEPSGLCLAPHC
jgi:hypothetical protein